MKELTPERFRELWWEVKEKLDMPTNPSPFIIEMHGYFSAIQLCLGEALTAVVVERAMRKKAERLRETEPVFISDADWIAAEWVALAGVQVKLVGVKP